MAYWLRAQDYGRTTLSEAVDADDTTLLAPLADHGRFPAASAGDNNFILTLWDSSSYRTPLEAFEADDLEQVLVTTNAIGLDPGTGAPVITSMTVTRGYGGTTPQGWPAGTAMWLCDNAAVIAELQAALDAHTHTGAATQQTGAAIPIANITGMSTYNLTALTVKGTTYVHAGEYIKAYTDGTALYAGSTGGVLDLQQGTAAAGKSRSRVLQWCRDGISGGVQVAFAPVHDDANAYFRFAIFPKGSPAEGAGFTVFGDGAATYYSNWYQTSSDAGIAVRNNVTALNFRNGHAVSDTIAFGFGLNTSLITFRSDVIAGRGDADRFDIGTTAAPDALRVTGNLELGTTGSAVFTSDAADSVGMNAGDQLWADNTLNWARATLAERIMDIIGVDNIRALWIPDGRTGTTLKDFSGNARNATIGADLTTLVNGHCRYLPLTANAHAWEVADADWLSFGDGSTDSAFSLYQLLYPTSATSTARTFFGKFDQTTGSEKREYWFRWTDATIFTRLTDNSTGGYIGRSCSATVDVNAWQVIGFEYDGSATNAGNTVYKNAVQIDNANTSSGSYVAMENLTAKAGPFYTTTAGAKIGQLARNGVTILFTGVLTAAQRRRLQTILMGFAGVLT